MPEKVLSHSEVESLLSTLANDADLAPPSSAPAPQQRTRVNPYDFKRPERVGKDQMRALQSLHESFARNFGANLSAMLRTVVDARLTSVDQLTYSEFVFSLDTPTCFNVLKAEPLETNLILDIHPSVLYPIIDRLLGGGAASNQPLRRPLTEIELRIVSRVTNCFLKELRTAWANVIELDLGVERVESNPQLVQIVPPNEVVVLISFELAVGDNRGMLNLCIPFNALERVSANLSANTWGGYQRGAADDQSRAAIRDQIQAAEVELVVTLARTQITTSDLVELRVGDIITTDHDVKTPLEVAVEGRPKFTGSPGAWKGRKAVEVQ